MEQRKQEVQELFKDEKVFARSEVQARSMLQLRLMTLINKTGERSRAVLLNTTISQQQDNNVNIAYSFTYKVTNLVALTAVHLLSFLCPIRHKDAGITPCYRAPFDVLPAYLHLHVTDNGKNNTDLILIRFRRDLSEYNFYYSKNIRLHLPFTFSLIRISYIGQYLLPKINTIFQE